MATKIIPHQLADSLSYNPDTGDFVWVISPSQRTKAGSPAGAIASTGYVHIKWKGSAYKAHRVAWFIHHGEQPPALIDHINQDKADNSISNLRKATRSLNSMNIGKATKGVYRHHNGWQAQIRRNGKLISLYCGPDYGEAVRARQKAVDAFWSQHS